MPEYERSRVIRVAPEEVFAFATDPANLSTYLPTVRSAEAQPEGRVRVQGEVRGGGYDDDGWFRVDAGRRRMEWGADERNYAGWMTVSGTDGGAEVVVHLSFAPYFDATGRPRGEPAGENPVEQGLEAALDSLRNILEGRGGKEEPATTT